MDAAAVCPNPWCTCDPCRCEHPCTCGLRATSHGRETRWDANTSTLYHTVTTTYRRQPDGERPEPGHHHEPGPAPELPVVASDDVAAVLDSGDTGALAAYTRQAVGGDHDGQGHGDHTSIRRATHLGHEIEIHTSYRVMVNGRELVGHFGVDDDGVTHYHGLPNYQEPSAVDLVKQIIEQFPGDFPPRDGGEG